MKDMFGCGPLLGSTHAPIQLLTPLQKHTTQCCRAEHNEALIINIKGLSRSRLDSLRWLDVAHSVDVPVHPWYCLLQRKLNHQAIQSWQRGRNLKMERKWVILFSQDVLALDERWIRLPRVAPEAIWSYSPVVGPHIWDSTLYIWLNIAEWWVC